MPHPHTIIHVYFLNTVYNYPPPISHPCMQVVSDEPYPETGDVHHRGPASVQPADGTLPGAEEAVPALPGPYGLHWRGGQDGHQ